jgi:SAM-dependent methyltransferase
VIAKTSFLNKLAQEAHGFLQSHPRLKRLLRTGLARTGLLAATVPHVATIALAARRQGVAIRHLRGTGLEIGAMHFPLLVPKGVKVKYVDRLSKQEAIKRYPDLDGSRMVDPEIIEDGFTLASVPLQSQDFVIANHVLEHSPNPLQTLENWARVLRPGGVLYVTVPIAETCFDRGRAQTTIDHMVEDYKSCRESRLEQFSALNLQHYDEWVRISLPNVAREEGRKPRAMTPADIVEEVQRLAQSQEEIHFHTFSPASFEALLAAFARSIDPSVRVAEVVDLGGEVIGILRKHG